MDNKTFATDKWIAEALNNKFTSVFTCENMNNIPNKGDRITLPKVFLILKYNSIKAGGPDCIPAKFLHDYADKLVPMLHFIFQQSYNTGTLPSDWKKAMVTGIYNKGPKSAPENYRSVSLTCICSKIMHGTHNLIPDPYS